ncbi:MAG: AEC family transporter [Lachnospiraceae bacterium]|nr:AEC family transporter [Lachnospiraceae bacterium]
MNLLEVFMFTVNAILPLILLILLGYLLKKAGVLSKEFLAKGNKLVFRVCLPTLLFCNISSLESISDIPLNAVLFTMGVIILLVLLGYLSTFVTTDGKQKGVMMQCVFRSNFALIGIPLAEMIGGKGGVTIAAILSAFTIPTYNVLAVIVLSTFVNEKGKHSVSKQVRDIARNPLIIGVVLGLIALMLKQALAGSFVLEGLSRLTFIDTTLTYVSKMATPLALLVLGGQFDFRSIQGYRKQILVATVGRTIIAPLLGVFGAFLIMKLGVTTFAPATIAAFIALFGTPVAVSSAIMADEMNNDGQLAAQLVVWTSLTSIFTLFIFIFGSRMIGIL